MLGLYVNIILNICSCSQTTAHLVEHAGRQLQQLLVRSVVAHQHACGGATAVSRCSRNSTPHCPVSAAWTASTYQ
jgi:hypothetical protein